MRSERHFHATFSLQEYVRAAELPTTESVLELSLALLRQLAALHERGLVVPWSAPEQLGLEEGRLTVDEEAATPVRGTLDVAGVRGDYLLGYRAWEQDRGHHDVRTDVFLLGLLLASLATRLDLRVPGDLDRFKLVRNNLQEHNPALHPVLALVIAQMTELERSARPPSLAELVANLERRREQDVTLVADLLKYRSFQRVAPGGRRELVLSHLRDRLYDRSRRNRLLYFKLTESALPVSASSVPPSATRASKEQIRLASFDDANFRSALLSQEPFALASWLRFEDYPFLAPTLDRIRLDAARDVNEFGFSQLRLVLCFLHWRDLKNEPSEPISSPLVLLPVRLAKKRGVRDAYSLEASTEFGEVNPVLRHHLKQLYGLTLPEAVDLTEPSALNELHTLLVEQIRATEPAVDLERVSSPDLERLSAVAARRRELFERRARTRAHPSPSRAEPTPQQLPRPDATPRQGASPPENPHRWRFSVHELTLANFQYKKMSLASDYTSMLREAEPSSTFAALFPGSGRPDLPDVTPLSSSECFPVVDGDPTQLRAIALSRAGVNFVIQGPPGTGKSQTITNLIADAVAHGERVLFVCEKRAALDVVHQRLERQGLGALSAVLSDSQTDRRSFILALKENYETFRGGPGEDPAPLRLSACMALDATGRELGALSATMTQPAEGADQPLVALMRRLLELDAHPLPSEPPRWTNLGLLPEHRVFEAHRKELEHFYERASSLGLGAVFAHHPLRLVPGQRVATPEAARELRMFFATARGHLQQLLASAALGDESGGDPGLTLATWSRRAAFAAQVSPLSQSGKLALLDRQGPLFRELAASVSELRKLRDAYTASEVHSRGWAQPFLYDETEAALELARKLERNPFRFLLPSYWRLRRSVDARFDDSSWAVRPSLRLILERLLERYQLESSLETALARAREAWSFGAVPNDDSSAREPWAFPERLESLLQLASRWPLDPPQAWLTELRLERKDVSEHNASTFERWATATALFEELERNLLGWQGLTAPALMQKLEELERAPLEGFAPLLVKLDSWPPALSRAIRELPFPLEGLEALLCEKAVLSSAGAIRGAADGARLDALYSASTASHQSLLAANAQSILTKAHARFLAKFRENRAPTKRKPATDYVEGTKQLEHEFSKVTRFRAIRALMSGPAAEVIFDLKPIWLMSPLSVADALPLEQSFDVVVVDEASQIPMEDALPALERARRLIIVGDSQQLPPTSFFSAREPLAGDDDSALEAVVPSSLMDAESLLDHSARHLPSTMLGWHYRSRDEKLISFSNRAFYGGQLLTVPSVRELQKAPPIVATGPDDAPAGAAALLSRTLSFHRIHGAVYEDRQNALEASYLAALVRELLRTKTGLTLGIVAFSEAQQGEIEEALERLAKSDAEFQAHLDAAREREDEGQYVGLFVKNLENVQGDERDIILLSVCYGPDANGKMRMNFGPINQKGGERRLNVVFSRAKQHMAVVSSIDASDITNDANEGAACLKGYLRYVQAASLGDQRATEQVLHELSSTQLAPRVGAPQDPRTRASDPVAASLARALRDQGYEVQTSVGSSSFRVDVAVKTPGEASYRLGILIDTDETYQTTDFQACYRLKPGVLRAFGWKITWVLARDWLLDRKRTLERLEALLRPPSENQVPKSGA